MEQKVDLQAALLAFHAIRDRGERVDDAWVLNGLRATSDLDGYTITIKNDYISLTIFFHNKFQLDYSSSKELHVFLEKIQALAVRRNN